MNKKYIKLANVVEILTQRVKEIEDSANPNIGFELPEKDECLSMLNKILSLDRFSASEIHSEIEEEKLTDEVLCGI